MLWPVFFVFLLAFAPCAVRAHVAAWAKGMYCQNGYSKNYAYGTPIAAEPLWNMTRSQYWMHGPCINYPPPAGEFLELPVGKTFNVEIANNKAFTSMNILKHNSSDWADGLPHPELESSSVANRVGITPCIGSPNIHTVSQVTASGTAFAIAYKSDISQVTLQDLTVFTVTYHTPWKRVTTYEVPSDMPACPSGGCICAWGWIPNGCGIANMYMVPYRCNVTGARANAPKLAAPKVPQWCENDTNNCVAGAKQFMIWNQKEGANIDFARNFYQMDGQHPFPNYNMKMGFKNGAQNDIFETGTTASYSTPASAATKTVTVHHTVTSTVMATGHCRLKRSMHRRSMMH